MSFGGREELVSDVPKESGGQRPAGMARRWTFAVLALAFLFVLMPFLFWQSTWFGRPLTDEEIGRELADAGHPRKTQHALSQIADRIVARDPTATRWYPQVVVLSKHKAEEIRLTAAWVMGQDNTSSEFHQALLGLRQDRNPMVRRNAALSLVRFADAAGRAEIIAMLRPYPVQVERDGTLAPRLKAGDAVNVGTLLGRLKTGETETEIRAQVPGVVERWVAQQGAGVKAGDEIVLISPSPAVVWEALRALVLIGTPDDLPDVERYIHPVEGMPDLVRQQAQLTARAIRSRAQR